VLQVGDQIRQVLRRHVLFHSFRHQGKIRGFDFGDVASQNLFLQAAALDEREAGGCLGFHHAGERAAVLRFDLVVDKARFDRGVRIENGEQKILWAFGPKRGQIRPHGMSLAAQGVATRAVRGKNRLAPARISGQIQNALVFGQHLSAASS